MAVTGRIFVLMVAHAAFDLTALAVMGLHLSLVAARLRRDDKPWASRTDPARSQE
jgi:hypothetical protein